MEYYNIGNFPRIRFGTIACKHGVIYYVISFVHASKHTTSRPLLHVGFRLTNDDVRVDYCSVVFAGE